MPHKEEQAAKAQAGATAIVTAPFTQAQRPAQPVAAFAPPASYPTDWIIIDANQIQGHREQDVEAIGNAELYKGDESLFAEQLTYYRSEDKVVAEGNVKLQQRGNILSGPKLDLKLDENIGFMDSPTYELAETHARGDGSKLLFEGKDKYRVQDARYTTCPVGQDDWFLNVADLEINRTTEIGTAHNAYVEFHGVPLLYTPWMTFPLVNQRKSGFLTPSIGTTGNSGAEVTIPYYWNIAPNRDATITPRILARRGLQVGGEFRYLDASYQGILEGEVLPSDAVTGTNRYALSVLHQQNLGHNWSASLNVQKVSDNNYFRDLSTRLTNTAQTNLLREGTLFYGGGWWNFTGRIQRYQTLQDLSAPIVPPYHRVPQLLLSANKQNLIRGTDFSFAGEFVEFSHPTLVNGSRLTLYPSISLPLTNSFGYITPKIGVHMTRYTLDKATTTLPDTTLNLPVLSVDSGMVMERHADLFGQPFTQTLEPRLYYVYIPYRDQSQIPNFDTAVADFNFAQIFTENQFTGGDRINDANQVTLALTSRLLEPSSGSERLRAAIGQRYYLKTPQVTLATPPRTSHTSDFLAALGGQLTRDWSLDTGWQYNPNANNTEKLSMAAHYRPEPGKVVNLSYRFNRNAVGQIDPITQLPVTSTLRQVDLSTQWPITNRWSGLARWNYSIHDRKILEGVAGLEYNGGCWALRTVIHRFATATSEATNAFFLQLELNGVSRLGSNPLEILQQNISGYTKTNE